jgi:polysaccharide export outer membrane protein
VRREGSLRLEAPMTVLQALAESGGLTDYANRGGIYILRIENNQRFRLPFDYNAVVKGRKPAQNVLLQPGDTVVVPR